MGKPQVREEQTPKGPPTGQEAADDGADARPPDQLTESEWKTLMARIRDGACTPFLGAGAPAGTLPLGREIAEKWADGHGYPFEDRHDLARVAQFVAVMDVDPIVPKERLAEMFAEIAPPDFTAMDEPHGALASLPLPLYVTTNYDDFMYRALEQAGKEPTIELCRWNTHPKLDGWPVALPAGYMPSAPKPVVFHLHGQLKVLESLVLTEDDYLDFVVATGGDPRMLLPEEVKRALTSTSLMFVGYSLADWDFRVLHRAILSKVARTHKRLSITVQLERDDPRQREYLEKYFSELLNVKVFWGTAGEFAEQLRRRWKEFCAGD